MILRAGRFSERNPAQRRGQAKFSYAPARTWRRIGVGRAPHVPACGPFHIYRYPSPSPWSGPFRVRPGFFSSWAWQGFATAAVADDSAFAIWCDSRHIDCSSTHKEGGAACEFSNFWSCRQWHLRCRDALTMMASAPWPVRRAVRSSRMRWVAARSQGPRPAPPAGRFATTRASATDIVKRPGTGPAIADDKATGASRPGGLSFVLAAAAMRRPDTGRDSRCSKRS